MSLSGYLSDIWYIWPLSLLQHVSGSELEVQTVSKLSFSFCLYFHVSPCECSIWERLPTIRPFLSMVTANNRDHYQVLICRLLRIKVAITSIFGSFYNEIKLLKIFFHDPNMIRVQKADERRVSLQRNWTPTKPIITINTSNAKVRWYDNGAIPPKTRQRALKGNVHTIAQTRKKKIIFTIHTELQSQMVAQKQ